MRPLTVVVATTAIVALGALAPATQAGGKASTTLDFRFISWDAEDSSALYGGVIGSGKLACKDGRKVTVYRRLEGDDRKIGTATSERSPFSDYRWLLEKGVEPKSGDYYAKTGATNQCKAARSNTVTYP